MPPDCRGAGRRIVVASGTTAPFGIDTTVPSTARMYDWWLGGHDNFAADRAAALAVSEAAPEAQLMAVENRRFPRRAVRYLAAETGITQFLDIGTGLPTQGNVHQVAQDINPAARVVYVDNDPMVLAHSRALKTGGNTVVIEADLREPRVILDHPGTRKLIDFSQPLAVLLVAVCISSATTMTLPRSSPPSATLSSRAATWCSRTWPAISAASTLPAQPCTTRK